MAIEKKWVAGPGGVPVIDPSTANADYARATAPAPISTPTSTVDTTPVVSRYKSELTDYLNKMPPMPTEESMAKTRQDYRNQAQAQIDAITATYANKLKTATTEGEGRLGQTLAIGARRGLLGSPMAEAQKEQTTKYNEQVIGAIEAQKQQEIGLIFDKFDQRAQEAINQQKNEAITGANTYLNYLKENQAEARSDFQIIAKSKKIASLNLFSSVDIENWQKQTGWDDFMLQTVFDINKPSAQQIDWDKRVIGNTLIWSGIDPVTGQLKTITKELPAKLEATKYESIVTPDGTLIFYNPTDPNDIKTYGVEGQYAKPEKNANEIRTLSPGQTLVDANGKVIYSVPEDEDNKTVNVSPGQSVINPKTGEIIYTAPAKATDDFTNMPSSWKEWSLAGKPGEYVDWVKKLGLRPLPPTQATTLSEGFQIPLVTKSLEEFLDENNKNYKGHLFGPVEGLKAKNPWDIKHKTIDDDLRRASQVIGRYMEGGVLRKEDEEKYRRMLPQITDTVKVAKDKLSGVYSFLAYN